MAFDLNRLNNITSGAARANRQWAYTSDVDALAAVLADTYFVPARLSLSVGDTIQINATNGFAIVRITAITTTSVVLATVSANASDTVIITAAEMLALAAAPKTLVAAPGAGKVLVFESVQLYLDYNSVVYTITAAGDDLSVRYNNGTGQLCSGTIDTAGFLDTAADGYAQGVAIGFDGGLAAVANLPLVLDNIGANEFTGGDSPLYAFVKYQIQDVPF